MPPDTNYHPYSLEGSIIIHTSSHFSTMRLSVPFRSMLEAVDVGGATARGGWLRVERGKGGHDEESTLRFALRQVGAERHESRSRRRDQCTRGRLRSQPPPSSSTRPSDGSCVRWTRGRSVTGPWSSLQRSTIDPECASVTRKKPFRGRDTR